MKFTQINNRLTLTSFKTGQQYWTWPVVKPVSFFDPFQNWSTAGSILNQIDQFWNRSTVTSFKWAAGIETGKF